MWCFLLVLLLLSAQSGHTVVLDRDQLNAWYPGAWSDAFWFFYLNHRQITSISAGTFTGLTNLRQLVLDFNQLTTLPSSIFYGLRDLEVLWLQNNQLTTLHPSIFSGLYRLKELDLSWNQITTFDRNIFSGLIKLEIVDVRGNRYGPWDWDYIRKLCSTNPLCTIKF